MALTRLNIAKLCSSCRNARDGALIATTYQVIAGVINMSFHCAIGIAESQVVRYPKYIAPCFTPPRSKLSFSGRRIEAVRSLATIMILGF